MPTPTDWTPRLNAVIPCGSSTLSKAPSLPPDITDALHRFQQTIQEVAASR